jgi:hypothetical protein
MLCVRRDLIPDGRPSVASSGLRARRSSFANLGGGIVGASARSRLLLGTGELVRMAGPFVRRVAGFVTGSGVKRRFCDIGPSWSKGEFALLNTKEYRALSPLANFARSHFFDLFEPGAGDLVVKRR